MLSHFPSQVVICLCHPGTNTLSLLSSLTFRMAPFLLISMTWPTIMLLLGCLSLFPSPLTLILWSLPSRNTGVEFKSSAVEQYLGLGLLEVKVIRFFLMNKIQEVFSLTFHTRPGLHTNCKLALLSYHLHKKELIKEYVEDVCRTWSTLYTIKLYGANCNCSSLIQNSLFKIPPGIW